MHKSILKLIPALVWPSKYHMYHYSHQIQAMLGNEMTWVPLNSYPGVGYLLGSFFIKSISYEPAHWSHTNWVSSYGHQEASASHPALTSGRCHCPHWIGGHSHHTNLLGATWTTTIILSTGPANMNYTSIFKEAKRRIWKSNLQLMYAKFFQ